MKVGLPFIPAFVSRCLLTGYIFRLLICIFIVTSVWCYDRDVKEQSMCIGEGWLTFYSSVGKLLLANWVHI